MARHRKEKTPKKIPLSQPDRSGPSQATLLDIAEQRGLLKTYDGQADSSSLEGRAGEEADTEALVGRLGESVLWSISLTMLHFTLDVLISHQYGADSIVWQDIMWRALQAFPVIFLLMYFFHQHPTPSPVIPPLAPKALKITYQTLFFVGSVSAGCYLIYITNMHGYYAVMKQSPPLGCLWIWSVIELDLVPAVGSLLWCVVFLKWGGYNYL
ncbi:hypothetical protein ONS95_008706 [Cadophora gregata]|uniref:uncharacterized protein n=1 Tax=Cadophora gregata TaxID=51156 RepID=UPI0026DD9F72|nr:uncharacterized protein ONS95_008706 [Cadophora gregata]KAK0123696.1 hypothetical protein ONS95_008706 [Cadophora gregata]KAK0130041.1 hypothetical protein ONS96_000579 [Cadophora gregata f. sp. sojae]